MVRLVYLAACLVIVGAQPAYAGKRVALVIGNSSYAQAGKLPNPVNDATEMAKSLTGFGFEVILGIDLDRRGFDDKVRAFSRALQNADDAVLFYAGHGLQVAGKNYLIPVDAQLKGERDLDFEAVQLDFVLKQMETEREGKTNIVFLDACRDNPFARNLARSMGTRSANIGRGLAEVQTGVGTFIAFSTQPGNVALDGDGKNSPFTAAFVKRVQGAGRNLTTIMIDVRKDVLDATQGRQVPWDHSALTRDFYFATPAASPESGTTAVDTEALQKRLAALEEQLKQKADPGQTANIVVLSQLKERVRQLDETIHRDQERLFDAYRTHGPATGPEDKMKLNLEIANIQMEMTRRVQDKRALQEQIVKLQKDMGAVSTGAQAR